MKDYSINRKQKITLFSYDASEEQTIKENNFKMIFLIIEDTTIEYLSRHFQLHRDHEAVFSIVNNLYKLQKKSEETLKCYCIIFI